MYRQFEVVINSIQLFSLLTFLLFFRRVRMADILGIIPFVDAQRGKSRKKGRKAKRETESDRNNTQLSGRTEPKENERQSNTVQYQLIQQNGCSGFISHSFGFCP
jgi:hypothetical protein